MQTLFLSSSFKKSVTAFLMLTIIIPASFMALPKKAEAIPVAVIEDSYTLYESVLTNLGLPEWITTAIKSIVTLANTIIIKAKVIITAVETEITAIKTAYLALKEEVLDKIASYLGTELTNLLTKELFHFVTTGNFGGPAFVTDMKKYLEGVKEEQVELFLNDMQKNSPGMLSSLQKAVRKKLIKNEYIASKIINYSTFPGGDAGYKAYLKDPKNCQDKDGNVCLQAAIHCENDPECIYRNKLSELEKKKAAADTNAKNEVVAGKGFHNIKDCIEKSTDKDGNETGFCEKYVTETPGAVVSDQVHEYLGNALKKAQAVDESGELSTALFKAVNLALCFSNNKGLTKLAGCLGGAFSSEKKSDTKGDKNKYSGTKTGEELDAIENAKNKAAEKKVENLF